MLAALAFHVAPSSNKMVIKWIVSYKTWSNSFLFFFSYKSSIGKPGKVLRQKYLSCFRPSQLRHGKRNEGSKICTIFFTVSTKLIISKIY